MMQSLDGATYKGRKVRCNDAEEGGHGRSSNGRSASGNARSAGGRGGYGSRGEGRQDARERRDVVVDRMMTMLLAHSISSRKMIGRNL